MHPLDYTSALRDDVLQQAYLPLLWSPVIHAVANHEDFCFPCLTLGLPTCLFNLYTFILEGVLLVGMYNGAATMENSMLVPQVECAPTL